MNTQFNVRLDKIGTKRKSLVREANILRPFPLAILPGENLCSLLFGPLLPLRKKKQKNFGFTVFYMCIYIIAFYFSLTSAIPLLLTWLIAIINTLYKHGVQKNISEHTILRTFRRIGWLEWNPVWLSAVVELVELVELLFCAPRLRSFKLM